MTDFIEGRSVEEFWTRNAAGLSHCVQTALADAGIHHDEVRTWVVPNFGDTLLRKQCFEPMKIRPERIPSSAWTCSPATGDVASGDRIVLPGISVGVTWGCAVVEATDPTNLLTAAGI